MTDPTTQHVVFALPGMDRVEVERRQYTTPEGNLAFDFYRSSVPTTSAVILVSGYPDPGMAKMLGKPLMEWTSYQQWARLIAASGVNAVTYLNRTPADVFALIDHLRAAPLYMERLALWACSGNAPMALDVLGKGCASSAALLYPLLLDVEGATHVADAAATYRFVKPPIGFDDLAAMPMLLVRAGADLTPGLNVSFDRFASKARARYFPVTVTEHAAGPHAFDVMDDSVRSREVIADVLGYLCR